MLRINAPAPPVEREQVSPSDGDLGETVELVWVLLRRQYLIILFAALLTIALAVIYLLTAPPKHTVHASMILDVRGGQFFQQQSTLANAPTETAWQESLKKDLASAASRSVKTNVTRVKLNELESFAQSFRTLRDSFLQRCTESVQQQSFPITDARIMSGAARPLERSIPRIGIILPLACIGDLDLGAALGFVREVMDGVFGPPSGPLPTCLKICSVQS